MKKVLIISDQMLHDKVITGGIETRIMLFRDFIIKDAEIHIMLINGDSVKVSKTANHEYTNVDYTYYDKYDDIYLFGFPWHIVVEQNREKAIKMVQTLMEKSFNIFIPQVINDVSYEELTSMFKVNIILANSATIYNDKILVYGGLISNDFIDRNQTRENKIVTIGRIHSDKGQLSLVREYKDKCFNIHKVPLYIYGGNYTKAYFEEVNKFVDNESVFHKEWISHSEVIDILNTSKYHVMNSPVETFSFSTIEAMACNCTAIVNGKYIGQEDGFANYVYGNTDKHGNIHELINNAIHNNIQIKGREWVLSHYNIDLKSKQIINFINKHRI